MIILFIWTVQIIDFVKLVDKLMELRTFLEQASAVNLCLTTKYCLAGVVLNKAIDFRKWSPFEQVNLINPPAGARRQTFKVKLLCLPKVHLEQAPAVGPFFDHTCLVSCFISAKFKIFCPWPIKLKTVRSNIEIFPIKKSMKLSFPLINSYTFN